jgi:CxxC-x17-CxxC domain-containing protein
MADFRRDNRGGGNRFGGGGRSFGRPNFEKKSWDKGGDRGEVTMHEATCAECGDKCEVPFRPMQGKPVYCKNCFATKGGSRGGDDRGPRRDFAPRQEERQFSKPQFIGGNDDTKRQLELLNTKFDKLIKLVETFVQPKAVETMPITAKKVKLLPPELTKKKATRRAEPLGGAKKKVDKK